MRPLLVGEAPTRRSRDERLAFTGRSGDFLSDLLGRPVRDVFDCRNLFVRPVAEWPTDAARAAANRMLEEERDRRVILLAGRRVARAALPSYLAKAGWFTPVGVAGATGYVIPHPSGLNRWWNDKANRDQARAFLRLVAEQGAAEWQQQHATS